jgi:hypothetical protein
VSALGSGLVEGIFFAFSGFIMKALARVPPAPGIAVMQSINLTVLNIWFFAVFFGTGACCLVLGISSLFRLEKPGAGYLLAGSLLYLIGTIIVTIAMQRAAERCARRSRPIECRRWSRADRLSQEVDGLESPADRSGPGRGSFVYRWTLSRCFTVRFCSS